MSIPSQDIFSIPGCLLSHSEQEAAPSGRRIILVRHGEIQDAHLMRCIGRLDVPLSKKGHSEAHQAGKWLQKQGFSFSLWSSPLTRCRQTAKAIQEETGCGPIHTEDDLMEMAAGAWEGMTFTEIQEKHPKEYEERGKNLIHYHTPDGESFFDAGARFLGGIKKILEREDAVSSAASENAALTDASVDTILAPLVIVAHSGVIRSALCHLGAWSFDYMLCIPQPNAGITILQAKKTANPSDSNETWKISPTVQIGVPTAV